VNTVATVASITLLLSFIGYIVIIKPHHRHRFFLFNESVESYYKRQFFRTEIDDAKAHAASINKMYNMSYRESDIRPWFVENYPRWKQEDKSRVLKTNLLNYMDDDWIREVGDAGVAEAFVERRMRSSAFRMQMDLMDILGDD